MLSSGIDYRQKNQARRMHQQGMTPLRISQALSCEPGVVERYLSSLDSPSPAGSDKFGPLPGSPEWNELSPGARSGLTRKQQNAERAQDA